MRDNQKAKVYHAENLLRTMLLNALDGHQAVVFGSTLTLPPEGQFGTPADVQGYVDRVLAHPGVVAQYGRTTIRVRKRKGNTKAHYCMGEIALPDDKWALNETVVLHEIAHHFSPGDHHGEKFTKAYLTLVGLVMGPEAELVLRMLYAEGDVR
jgi:putative metallohydrolase (TIGR04338 family)